MRYLPFIISTGSTVNLVDLGERIIGPTSNFDLGQEFYIEELTYSQNIAEFLYDGSIIGITDSYNNYITGASSLELTKAALYTSLSNDAINQLAAGTTGATADALGNPLGKYEYTGFATHPYVAMKAESPLTKSELTDKIMDCLKYGIY